MILTRTRGRGGKNTGSFSGLTRQGQKGGCTKDTQIATEAGINDETRKQDSILLLVVTPFTNEVPRMNHNEAQHKMRNEVQH